MRLIRVVSFRLKEGQLLDRLDSFEAAVVEYENEAKNALEDDLKVVVVIKGGLSEGAPSTRPSR